MNKDEAINLLNDMLLTCNVKEPYTEAVEFAVDSIKNLDRTIDAFVDVTDVLCSHLQTISTKVRIDNDRSTASGSFDKMVTAAADQGKISRTQTIAPYPERRQA